jgi:hypothetical protein
MLSQPTGLEEHDDRCRNSFGLSALRTALSLTANPIENPLQDLHFLGLENAAVRRSTSECYGNGTDGRCPLSFVGFIYL